MLVLNYSPLVFRQLQDAVVKILETLYAKRLYARFYVLETIARVPYFGTAPLHMVLSFVWGSISNV